jgi:hypothetical protein
MLLFGMLPLTGFAQDETAASGEKVGGVTSLERRVEELEEAIGRKPAGDKWYDRIQISGLVEVEANYQKADFKNPAVADTDESDVDLATVELAVDARIVQHVDAHVLFKYETDTALFVDEGFITLVGSEAVPAYLIAGRQYIPFGNFESHFVTDPLTLDLGETNEGAVLAGYRFGGEKYNIAVGAFNGKAPKANEDSTISNFVASFTGAPLESLEFGVSYTSNLAAAGGLNDSLTRDLDGDGTNDVESYVGGWSAFATVSFMKFKLIGEYVGAVGEFEVGEVFDASGTDTQKKQPAAWNLEIGYAITDAWEVAGRYESSSDTDEDVGLGQGFAETRYGAVVNWGIFDNTNLAMEYLHSDYKDDFQTEDTFTAQLAVEF